MNRTIKSTFLLALLSVFSMNLNAQDDRDFRIGFKVIPGFDWTKAKPSNALSNGLGIGFGFGLMADIKLDENYFITPEIQVTSMTNNIKLKDNLYTLPNDTANKFKNISYKYNLKYIEIPISFKFRTNESNGIRYWGQIGLSTGFLIGNQVNTSATSVGNGIKFPMDEKYIPNGSDNDKYDFTDHNDNVFLLREAMILGAGIEYNLSGNTSFYTGVRFNNGFTDILSDKKSRMINNVLGLELGFFF